MAAWAQRKARLADGTRPGVPVVDPETASAVFDESSALLQDLTANPRSGRMQNPADLMKVALLRDAAGSSFVAIAARLHVSVGTPQKLYRLHRECIDDQRYRDAYVVLVDRALRSLHGPPSA